MKIKPIFILTLFALLISACSANPSPTATVAAQVSGDITPLKDAKLIIEHNATDEDTGFQGFVDGEGWQSLVFTGPGGQVLTISGQGKLGNLGLTELFFETVEPENADVSITEMLTLLPEGNYTIEGPAIEAGEGQGQTRGIAWLTHNIPAGPVLLSPAEDAVVSADDELVISWSPVTKTIDGSEVNIISYQLIIEKDEEPHPHMIGKIGLSMYLPASVTSTIVPRGFLEPGTSYNWEVLAIEESGNQTLSSSNFRTQ
ncbi:MAG: YgdI/YgdR family lipoprotein [Chloroflexi bacterium]|nr:YgdI/YgdR family lipoprotein [Chloroflexota bacterium]MCI0576549.1 YgdI/YgdR family lipoprotein [Chloroflexota bacterium]MCI0646680.1 YgdI/YgdR family lipoprotein [Chloroflexota bacterium]MCI0727533.1 YgdI/YgdR family lipoprotein [Chloroflexota bacterium]